MKLNNKRTILVGLAFMSICAFWQLYDNIIPLIPQFELADQKAPTCLQIDEARTKAAKHIDVFRHCQHCRADAVGVPGKSEYGDQIYQRRLNVKETFSHG